MVQNTEKRESCNLALVMVVVRGLAVVVVAGTYQERSGVPAQQQAVVRRLEQVRAVHEVHVVVPRLVHASRHRRGVLVHRAVAAQVDPL